MSEISRRDLFTFWRKKPPPKVQPKLRPPGALDEADFIDTCRRCGKCIEVCPRQALGPVIQGIDAGTPFLVPRQAPCVVCDGLQCTHVCPTGALRPIVNRLDIHMGTAKLAADRCLAHQGRECRACVDACPIPRAIAMVPGKSGQPEVPLVDEAVCIGCGLCENYCPPEPAAIWIKPLR